MFHSCVSIMAIPLEALIDKGKKDQPLNLGNCKDHARH